MRVQLACLLAVIGCVDNAAAADAITYTGTIGKLSVIVELAAPGDDGTFLGRYAYLSKGIDIPLHGTKSGKSGDLQLEEEKPCTEKLCKATADDVVEVAPIAGDWALSEDKGQLVGTWHDKESGKSLPVRLERKAKRVLPEGSDGFDAIDPTFLTDLGNPPVLSKEDLPYDFLKMSQPFKQGAVVKVGDSAYRMERDTRTGLEYPVVVKLDGEDPGPLNAYLLQQRLQLSLPAFSCMARKYLGFGWYGMLGDGTTGYEDNGPTISVEHFSPRLMGIDESGTFYCVGAHPDNFDNHYLVDASTGEALVPQSLLRGWIATNADGVVVDPSTVEDESTLTFGPSEDLIKFVIDHRQKIDPGMESECGIDAMVRTNLGVYFTQDTLVFTLQDLPYVSFACTNDLLKVPLKDARPLLTDAAAKYFPVLDR